MTGEERRAGHASPKGTRQRAEQAGRSASFYDEVQDLTLSRIGVGTYLGETDPEAREAYRTSIERALEAGVTVVDTASNYRHQASERDVGEALDRVGDREETFVVTKGGFLHGDVDEGQDPQRFLQERYLEPGRIGPGDIAGGAHCMAPAFLAGELERSRRNLGLETVDLYLVHNPETQLGAGLDREQVHERLQAAFAELERRRAEGQIHGYGVATWDALRVSPGNPEHLSLERLLELAEAAHEEVGGDGEHGFRGLQLPFNLAMHEAVSTPTQPWQGELVPAIEAAGRAGLVVLTSASLLQGRLLGTLPPEVRQAFDAGSDLEAALAIARSPPQPTTALVGMGTPEHVDENLDAADRVARDPEVLRTVLEAVRTAPEGA